MHVWLQIYSTKYEIDQENLIFGENTCIGQNNPTVDSITIKQETDYHYITIKQKEKYRKFPKFETKV